MAQIDHVRTSHFENSGGEQCVLLIPAPTDAQVYRCCRAIAWRLQVPLTCERLWLEQDVPLTPGLCEPKPPSAISRVLACDCMLIARIQLEVGGLQIDYVRSGGHDPFRESFFDEVRLSAVGVLQLDQAQVQEVIMILCTALDAAALRGSPLFTQLHESALRDIAARVDTLSLGRTQQ